MLHMMQAVLLSLGLLMSSFAFKKITLTKGHRKTPRSSQISTLTHGVKCCLTVLLQGWWGFVNSPGGNTVISDERKGGKNASRCLLTQKELKVCYYFSCKIL